jgi:2-aminoadipate transaminase
MPALERTQALRVGGMRGESVAWGGDPMSSLEAVLSRPDNATWSDRFAQRTEGMTSSMIRELLKLTERPEIISFAGGLPAPEAFPVHAVAAASQRVLETHGPAALQYGPTEGYLPLRELLVKHMGRYGIAVTPDNVLITCGAQQALDLVGRLLINPGDHVATEEPTYLGALQAFRAYQAQYLPVPLDQEGMRLGALERALRGGPKFLYALPNFQNPTGATMSLERRQRVVELASYYGTPILEDDPYGQLRYEGEHLPTLVTIDAEMHGSIGGEWPFRGSVLYLGTLSKILGPGLRIGWVVAPEEVVRKLVQLKQGADLHTGTFSQMVAYETARGGFLDEHVRYVRKVYGRRRDAMLRSLEAHFPEDVHWTRPQGGLFLWVTLPPELDSANLLGRALRQGVAFVPGRPFFPAEGGGSTLRLNFSYCPPPRIEEGIGRLGAVIRRALAERRQGVAG